MILIDVSGANAIVRKQDTLTSGMVGATVVFRFDEDWNSLAKTAVFRAGKVTKDAVVVDSISEIPHEVLTTHGYALEIGVYGTSDDGDVVIPTIWAKTNPIKLGADPSGDESLDPSLPVWAQMQEQLDSMYRNSGEIKAAKEELMQAIDDAKEDLDDIVAAGGYFSKTESGTNFASAIHGNLSGAIVAADDVSPVEHFVSVKVHGTNLFNTFDPSTAMVHRYGKNLIQYPFSFDARTINGVTFTPKADGTIVVNGTATANTYFALNGGFSADAAPVPCTLKPGEEYTITDAMVFLYNADGTKAFNEGTFTMLEGYDHYGIFVHVPSGTTVAEVRRPQLELGNKATDYEVYTNISYVPLADGTVDGVLSLAPSMTFAADRDDVILEVTYNRATESHTGNKNNPHGVTAEQVGARPADWMPSAEDVGARPNDWIPSAEEVGARPDTWMPTAEDVGARSNTWMPSASDVGATPVSHTENKNNPHGVTAEQVGARPADWMPNADEVGARPNTWTPTASDVGARPNDWMPSASDVGARPDNWMPTAEQVGARANTWLPTIAEIGAAPDDFGLGAYVGKTVTDANEATKNGWYLVQSGASNAASPYEHPMLVVGYGQTALTQIAFMGNAASSMTYIVIRKRYGSNWNEWEHLNPGLSPGVEYRTTERWNGKPVYQILLSLGAFTNPMVVKAPGFDNMRVIEMHGELRMSENADNTLTVPGRMGNNEVWIDQSFAYSQQPRFRSTDGWDWPIGKPFYLRLKYWKYAD